MNEELDTLDKTLNTVNEELRILDLDTSIEDLRTLNQD